MFEEKVGRYVVALAQRGKRCAIVFLAGLVFLSTTLVFAVSAQAGVNSKNGNFFISYTDIIVTIGTEESM